MVERRGLQDIEFKVGYATFDNDVFNEFYKPCLDNSVLYNRISGYFSSEIFIPLLEGLKNFVKNNGKIHLILGRLPPKDFDVINSTKEELEEKFLNDLIIDIENVAKKSTNDHSKLLAWLLFNDHLKIKFAIMNIDYSKSKNENPNYTGFLHKKTGIFYDKNGNGVSYNGSNNFTYQGLKLNYEDFDVFMNWKDGKKENFDRHESNFNEFWEDNKRYFLVVELPNEKLKKIITSDTKISDEIFDKIDDFNRKLRSELLLEIKLKSEAIENDFSLTKRKHITEIIWRKPQLEGYNSWIDKEKKGILEIATGVGKTLIAIRAIYDFFTNFDKNDGKKIAALVLPDNLILQWEEELSDWLVDKEGNVIPQIYSVYGENKYGLSIEQLLEKIEDSFYMSDMPLVILAYYNTFSKKVVPFLNKLRNKEILFIADEVHEIGTEKRIKQFSKFDPNYLMGLSATPNRYFDKKGTDSLKKYFGDIIYEYTLAEGIEDGYLCDYKYKPIFCDLSNEKKTEYESYTKRIHTLRSLFEKEKNSAKKTKYKNELDQALFDRKRIIKKAESKYQILWDLVHDLKESDKLNHVLIYTEDNDQLGRIDSYLISNDYPVSSITQNDAMQQRKIILQLISKSIKKILLAIKILDQGIDIPNLNYGILMSSTGNIRQFIQRRGRLLRTAYNKKYAVIYDMVIRDIDSEITRVGIFYNDCSNKDNVKEICLEEKINIEKIRKEVIEIDREGYQ